MEKEQKENLEHSLRVVQNLIALLENGTFQGAVAPAVAEGMGYLKSFQSELEKRLSEDKNAEASK